MRIKCLIGVAAALAFAVSLVGCGGSGNASLVGQSHIRVFNAYIPSTGNTGTLTVTGNGTSIVPSTAAYGGYSPSSGYTAVTDAMITFAASGTNVTSTSLDVTLLSDILGYSLVAAGTEGQTGTYAPTLLLLPEFDPTAQSIGSTQFAVRFVNLTQSVNSAAVYNTVTGSSAVVLNSSLSGIHYGFSSGNNPYVVLTTTTVGTLSIRSTSSSGTDLTLTNSNLGSTTLQNGSAYTIYLYGVSGSTTNPLTATIVQDSVGYGLT